jgi:DNA-binding transcriptional MerR regulator
VQGGGGAVQMSHEIAKLLLEHAATFLDREEAIRSAIRLGMPLNEIEEYLDWLDLTRSGNGDDRPLPEKSP